METTTIGATLEVVSSGLAKQVVRITQLPFLIGRGAEARNHLQLDDRRIACRCAGIVANGDGVGYNLCGGSRGFWIVHSAC